MFSLPKSEARKAYEKLEYASRLIYGDVSRLVDFLIDHFWGDWRTVVGLSMFTIPVILLLTIPRHLPRNGESGI